MTGSGMALAGMAALLAAPGPTNLVLAGAGAQRGVRRAVPMLLPALAAYLVGISVLNLLLAHVRAGQVVAVLQGLAALWLALLAMRMWNAPGLLAQRRAGVGVVLTTTLLNPKVVIFAALVFAPGTFSTHAILFAALFLLTGLAWILVGAGVLGRLASGRTLSRALSLAQLAFAMAAGWAALEAI